MKADFDNAALKYDATFTNSVIGRMQRDLIYDHVSFLLKENLSQKILEINCGTGEDAIWLAKQDFDITATDISGKMIEVALSKSNLNNVRFFQADINKISTDFEPNSFDLIFSNFGGLNCLSPGELASFLKNATSILTQSGKLALVIMPKNALWEQLYLLLKMDFRNIFRRKREYAIAHVDGQKVKTFYYNPKDIVNLANTRYFVHTLKPIGFFIPPSYLESYFKNKFKVISFLRTLDQIIKNITWLARYSDHYLIVLQKK